MVDNSYKHSSLRPLFLALLIVLPVGLNLSQYWLHNPLYGYGCWALPLVALLLWRRGTGPIPRDSNPRKSGWGVIVAYFAAVPVLRIVQIANPDWRLVDWVFAGSAIVALLALVWQLGGGALLARWWFPICILLTAVPWSTSAEQILTNAASPAMAAIASEALWSAGQPSVDEGRVLQTAAGPISVGEGCSGIRGLQLAIMASLFWAAFFWLGPMRGLALLLGGLVLALLLNVLRVTIVAGVAIHAGRLEAGEQLHDLAGTVAQLLLIAALPVLALLLRSRTASRATVATMSKEMRWDSVTVKAVLVWLVWLVASEAAAQGWFRLREGGGQGEADGWIVHRPLTVDGATEQPMPAQIREGYRFSDGLSANWQDAAGGRWSLFWLDFGAGEISACTHNVHRPEICLPSHDSELVQEFPDLDVSTESGQLRFHHQLYHRGSRLMHLFYTTVEETRAEPRTIRDWSYAGRLEVAWRGIRSQRSEMIHLLAETPSSPDEVRKAAEIYLGKLLFRQKG
jgi:exosortase